MKFKKTAFLYILSQIIPTFLLGVVVFIFIILMFQFLKVTDTLLRQNAPFALVFDLLFSMSISLLPIIFPMSLLFSVVLTYSRLSTDSEVVAFKSLGYSPLFLATPAVAFSIIIAGISAQTLFSVGPIAKLHSEDLKNILTSQEAMSSVQEGTFSEGFFDMVLYANEVDKENKLMRDLFLYDGRNPKNPVAIIAKEGRISTDRDIYKQVASILLTDGDIYKLASDSHTKVKFDTYELQIASPTKKKFLEKDPDTHTLNELYSLLKQAKMEEKQLVRFQSEFQGRWALAASCLLFGFLGSALGSRTNRRSSSSSGFVVTVICIVLYWVLYVAASNLSNKMVLDPILAAWLPNGLFLIFTIWAWRHHLRA